MNIIAIIMLCFSCLGALDRIIGNRFGLGKEFEKGLMLLGNISLSLFGMIVIAPFLAELMTPCFDFIYNLFGIDPSVIPASLLANDMGGAPMAVQVAKDSQMGLFSAMVVSSMMGCTLSFNIPYALGVVKSNIYNELFYGMLCGFVTIPVGCFVAGLVAGLPIGALLLNLLPLILLSGLIVCGLLFLPKMIVKVFVALGIAIKALVTIGLILGIFEFVTGITLIESLADIEEGVSVGFNAVVTLSGAFPLMYIVTKLLKKPMELLGAKLGINNVAATGFLASLVTNATTFEMMERMDKKGIVLNAAFCVSASFIFSSHLAYTLAFAPNYLPFVTIGKAVAGVLALILASLIYTRLEKNI